MSLHFFLKTNYYRQLAWRLTLVLALTVVSLFPQVSVGPQAAVKQLSGNLANQVRDATVARQQFIDSLGQPQKVTKALVTAYSSTPDQTDGDPFTTASGRSVRPGVLAANWLPFGTMVRFPDSYPDRFFVVEDRMNPRHERLLDIWMSSRQLAQEWGARVVKVEIWYPAKAELASN